MGTLSVRLYPNQGTIIDCEGKQLVLKYNRRQGDVIQLVFMGPMDFDIRRTSFEMRENEKSNHLPEEEQ